ncbi:hypothetical protein L873DRAFT_1798391, partial [Choiromyces venosus 120613-1]
QPRLFNSTSPSALMSSATMIRWSADQSADSKLDIVLNTVNRLQQDVASLNQAVQAQGEAIEDFRVGLAANTIRCDDMYATHEHGRNGEPDPQRTTTKVFQSRGGHLAHPWIM